MSMNSETRKCQNCKQNFVIEPEDFGFYEKIKVPPPTFCPECRLERRLAWMVDINLFKRKCDLCRVDSICKYDPSAPFVVYCYKCWWGDDWDAFKYGMDFDQSRSFLEQFSELFHKTPILGLSIDSMTGKLSPYVNHCSEAKNCYMIYYSSNNKDSMYGFYLRDNDSILNCSVVFNSELCFDSTNSFKNFMVFGSSGNITQSLDSAFLRDCDNCQYCFASANLKNKKYVYFNKQLTKEEYTEKMREIDLGSYREYQALKQKAKEHFKSQIPRPVYDTFSSNVTGSYVFESKNCKQCYDCNSCQDSKYLMLIKQGPVKDCWDYTDWGAGAELIYDSIVVGKQVSNIKFSWYVYMGSSNVEYSALCVGCKDCFGCVGLRNKQYCILNRQYSKEKYENLVSVIKNHMNQMPFVDKTGKVYKYGEFFPEELCSYPYNNSFANLFFPKTKEQALSEGLFWHDFSLKKHPITISSKDLPDNIKDTSDNILKEVIACSSCDSGYRVTKFELRLSYKMNVPLPRTCPFCRINEKIKIWLGQMKQIDRVCDQCDTKFKTHHAKEEAPRIFCKGCYQREIY